MAETKTQDQAAEFDLNRNTRAAFLTLMNQYVTEEEACEG